MRPNKRDELVRKALDVFYRNGFHATGMDKLVSETGVSKTSMYKHFRTKEDLILAVLRVRDENIRHWLYRRIEELSDTPKGQMLALFDALSEWFTKPEFRGCMFIKASAEFQEINHPIHAQSAAHKQILQDHFSEIAEAADANDPRLLARQLLLLKEGAIVSAVLARGGGLAGDPAADAKEAARGLIDLQIPST